MKKIFFTLGLMAAALALTNCAKQETAIKDAQPAKAGVPFSFNVGIDTKTTTTDGATISWADGDALNVFHAESGSTTYGSNDEFTLTSGTTFNGELQDGALTANAYDWYVIYPYNKNVITPAAVDKGYVTLGSSSNGTQTQVGASNKAHLAGSNIPLYGVAKGVKKGEALSMTLNQLVSVVKVSVTNSTASALPVNTVSFTAPEDVVGTYFLDITGAEVVYAPSGATYVSNTANLAVSNAIIAAGATEDFYIAIKPFSASSGEIEVAVNSYEVSLPLSSEVVFAPGKIKTIEFEYDYVEPVASLPFFIDGTGGSAAYTSTDGLSASGLGSDYSGSNSPYLTKFDSDNDYVQIHFNVAAGKVRFGVKMIGGAYTSYITLSGSADGASFTDIETFEISGAQNDILVFTSSNAINAAYRYLRLTFTKGSNVGLGALRVSSSSSPEIPDDPVISVTSDNPMEVANTASAQQITYTVANPVAGKSIQAATNVSWITGISTSTAGKVTFNVAAQADGDPARSGNITLSYSGAENVVVVVNQAKGNTPSGMKSCVFNTKSWGTTDGSDFSWTAGKDGAGFSNNGIQVTTAATGANGTTVQSFTGVSKVVVIYNTNKSAGEGTLELKIGSNTERSQNWAYSSGDGRTANYTCTFNIATPESGQITLTANTTTNSIYIVGVNVTASGMSN